MAYKATTVTFGSTGTKTITCGFQPIGYRVSVNALAGGSESLIHRSIGWGDGTNQYCQWFYDDGSVMESNNHNDRVVSQHEWGAGVLSEVLKASFHSFTATELKLTCNTANSGYQLYVEAWN